MAKAPIISPDNSATGDDASTQGKGRPTPTRREREKANQRPLVAKGKEAQKAQRDRVADQRNRARIGLANGEEKFLPERDKGPQRRFVRDYVDARWNVGELMIPIMVVILISSAVPALSGLALYVIWIYVLLVVIDAFLLGRRLKAKLAERYGADKLESRIPWYAAMRSLQLKPMRLPKPQVKRGNFPTL
ncbi:MAG: hypothetical protein JWP75_1906 [Frondihabitans sp.]|nr:hypothetical protein [Frondihabitans sp.]